MTRRPNLGNYFAPMMRLARVEAEIRPGAGIMMVGHDSWCDFLNDRGPCNCEPEFRVVRFPPSDDVP